MKKKERTVHDGRFRFIDFTVIVICLAGAFYTFNLFWNDLFQTIDSQNEQPIGTIVIKNNIVQRRIANRVLWDRLTNDSPAYSGDLIRTAEASTASLLIGGNDLGMDESTLVRIQRSPDGEGFEIDLGSGSLSLATLDSGEGSNITLTLMGRRIEVAPGTVLNAAADDEGMQVAVSEGKVTFIETTETGEIQRREIPSGAILSMDTSGTERLTPMVVVTSPRANARYLQTTAAPFRVNFAWNRINFEPRETLRLELANDRNFFRINRVIDNLNASAQGAFEAGEWYWRLLYNGNILNTGHFTVAQGMGPRLLSPARDGYFSYTQTPPQIRFQWTETPDASSYVVEIAQTANFANARRMQSNAPFFVNEPNLEAGTWYWRVLPIFPAVYEGSAAFSPAASFRIEQLDPAAPAPVQVAEEEPAAEEPTPAPQTVQPAPPPAPTPAASTLLAAPGNRLPANGHRIGIEQLQTQREIVFSWQVVPGANAYIFTLYEQTANGQRQIIQRPPSNSTSWTLSDLDLLNRGNFVWQVEAVNRNAGTIERRGTVAENSFVIDIPRADPVQIHEPGVLYGH